MKGDTTGQGVVPLRTILRNILNLIDSFEQRYKEGLDSYDQEFQDLKQFSENLKSDPGYLCKEGEKSVNRKKNRYKDILPFDYTRVILGDYGDVPGSDYINANFIKGASGSSAYIACQGPLPHTICEFWRMVVECEVQVIVMACNEQESGKHKCENYWVEEEGVEREFGQVTVWLKKSRQVCPDFLVRTMKIRYPNSKGEPEERSVCQFHYSAWPDHGVPLKVRPLLDMVRLIRDCQTSETLPVLVHCSAGCGRTGTICAIDYVWGLLRLGKLTPDFSLFNLVRDMRRQRIAMVQTKDQYILVHRAVRELFEEQLKIIDSHPYANVDINGLPLDIRKDLEEPVYETVQFVSTVKVDDDEVTSWKRSQLSKPVPPPIPPSKPDVTSAMVTVITKHDKEVENVERLNKEQENCKISKKSNGSPSSINKVVCTPSPSSDSHGEASGSDKDKDVPVEPERDLQTVDDKSSSKRGSLSKQGSSKSSLLRNPSIIKLKSFFEKSKDSKDDKEKKSMPTLSRAKSDVSSSSRFYANLASTFTSRANRYSPSRTKNSPTSASPPTPKEERREKAPSEKIKSKPALLAKPNISVKRSKSLRIIRPTEEPREHVSLISTNSIGTDIPDSSKLVRASISSSSSSSQPSSSSQSHLEANAIKVNVRQVEMPKLQKPVSKSVKAESMKATTSQDHRRTSSEESNPGQSRTVTEKPFSYSSSKKPEVPSKSHLADIPVAKGIYGTTRIKIGVKDDSHDVMGSHVKMNGKIRQKFGTVNPKILSSPSSGGGTLLTRSQSHVWQPSKTQQQIPVRIFSDENLSQMGTGHSGFDRNRELDEHPRGFDEPDGVKLIRKQSLPIAKLFSHKVKNSPPMTQNYETNGPSNSDADHINKEQPRSLNLTSHSTFLEARKRVPKTNPYANYTPGSDNNSFSDKSNSPLITGKRQEKSSAITQFHFGDNVPLLKNNGNVGNSSESSSNPGTPRNSLPGTPTQSIDVLYSPLSLNYPHTRGQSKSILKGSLSSTPSESDERLDIPRHNVSSSLQSQVPSNITGPQKISSVRIAVGIRERRNSFRQAVWKEDQAPTANSIPVENDKSENIYITTATSVPYFVKSSAMPLHPNIPSSANKYQTPPVTTSANPMNRTHRDYEPIWPDPASAGNPFKVGPSATAMSVRNTDSHDGITGNKMQHAGSHGPSQSQNKLESQVQERMAEIKVLLAELRAPGKVDESKQRSMNSKEPMPQNASRSKPNDLSQSYSAGDKTLQPTLPSTSTTNLKHHRSLRAPSRPQYQQGFTCFTFRKPSSFESITDQLCAEDLHLSREKEMPVLQQTATTSRLTSEPARNKPESSFQQQVPTKNGHPRLNEYVSLRACRSSSGTRTKMEPAFVMNGGTTSTSSSQHPQQPHHSILSKSDSTPIPPPRSKRMGTHRREQGDYANVIPHGSKPDREWVGKESNGFTSSVGGHNLPHRLQNGSSGLKPVRKDSLSDIEVADNHHHLSNGREFSRLTSTGSIPLTNGNAGQTSPKAIIRALGLFQAKAANVRSRFANWAESKDRPGSKRGNVNVPTNYNSSALTRRHDRSTERGGFVEGHGSLPVAATPSVSIAPGPSTSKHQYL